MFLVSKIVEVKMKGVKDDALMLNILFENILITRVSHN